MASDTEAMIVSDNEGIIFCAKTRKRKVTGRVSNVMKKLREQSHELGEDCHCKRLKCFNVVNEQNRSCLINHFNSLNRNDQNMYLAGLISVLPVKQRRSKNEVCANLHDASYAFRVRIQVDEKTVEVPVCFKAFLSLHGIGKKRIETIQKSLKASGTVSKDKRGSNIKKHKLPELVLRKIKSHISSFRGRNSHYSRSKTRKLYLPEDLNIKKMYKIYLELKNPPVSYETYRHIFNTNFNISFGYPRSDTCSSCDQFLAELKVLQSKLRGTDVTDEKMKNSIEAEIHKKTTENNVHKSKADVFYQRKKLARKQAMKRVDFECIAMDFQKNLPMPNLSTNDVYYKRQLTMHSFNIHVLSTNSATFYCYPEIIGGKGSNEVASLLHYFIFVQLSSNIRHLRIFCDSCGGQNKNFTVFRYLHYVVHIAKRLDSIEVTFPVRGHSYMECDRDMGLVNQKIPAELPEDWFNEVRSCRVKPEPFSVVEVDQSLLRNWTELLDTIYTTKPSYKSREIRELRIVQEHPRLIEFRNTYNGCWNTSVIRNRIVAPNKITTRLPDGQFVLPLKLYLGKANIMKRTLFLTTSYLLLFQILSHYLQRNIAT